MLGVSTLPGYSAPRLTFAACLAAKEHGTMALVVLCWMGFCDVAIGVCLGRGLQRVLSIAPDYTSTGLRRFRAKYIMLAQINITGA